MNLTYRTRRRLQFWGTIGLIALLVGILTWLCWVIWLERYVVYSREGAQLRFDLPQNMNGEVAVPPAAEENISIYYNEGSDAVELSREMLPLNGYYIDYNTLVNDIDSVEPDLAKLKSGTPIMIELKGGYGSLYYNSNLSNAVTSTSVNTNRVEDIIKTMKSKGFYTIARISAFRDWDFGNRNVPSGLYMPSRKGLWMDSGGCYWLNPTDSNVLSWLTSIILELRGMGFNEVMLDNFRFPAEVDKYLYSGDKEAALVSAANTLTASTSNDTFVLSFGTTTPNFALPDGRTRLYLSGVEAKDVALRASQATFENVDVRLVFLGDTNDTRFDSFSVLRPLSVAEGLEAQKADLAAMAAASEEQ